MDDQNGPKIDATKYSKFFSEQKLLKKFTYFAKESGRELLETAAQLYYALLDAKTPTWVKTLIIGTLGYFIFPLDTIPDFLPLLGYTDDLALLLVTLNRVSNVISEDTKFKAKELVQKIFTK